MNAPLLNIPDDYIDRIANEAVGSLGFYADEALPAKSKIAAALIKAVEEYKSRATPSPAERPAGGDLRLIDRDVFWSLCVGHYWDTYQNSRDLLLSHINSVLMMTPVACASIVPPMTGDDEIERAANRYFTRRTLAGEASSPDINEIDAFKGGFLTARASSPDAERIRRLEEKLMCEGAVVFADDASPSYHNCEDDEAGAVIPIPVGLRDELLVVLRALSQSPSPQAGDRS